MKRTQALLTSTRMAGIAMAVVAATVLTPRAGHAQNQGMAFGFSALPPNPNGTPGQIIDEVRLGLLGHDVGFLGDNIEHGPDVNVRCCSPRPICCR